MNKHDVDIRDCNALASLAIIVILISVSMAAIKFFFYLFK